MFAIAVVQVDSLDINTKNKDWVGILYDEATLSGLPDSRFTGYLYAKRLILRQRIISTAGDVPVEERHMIYCCHCQHKWGPYPPSYTTTSAFGKHFRAIHSQLPSQEEEYKSVIKRMAEATTTGSAGALELALTHLAFPVSWQEPGNLEKYLMNKNTAASWL